MTEVIEKTIPFSIKILSTDIAGCVYEIEPLLLKYDITQEELNRFGENLMDVLEGFEIPVCGSMFWILYKRICHKDIGELIDSVNDDFKKSVTREEILKYDKYGTKRK